MKDKIDWPSEDKGEGVLEIRGAPTGIDLPAEIGGLGEDRRTVITVINTYIALSTGAHIN